jgi:hypothetical protein
VRRVLSHTQTVSFVCSDEHNDEIVAGVRQPAMVGFPSSDVFEFDAGAADALLRQWEAATGSTPLDQWGGLSPLSVPGSRR